MEFDRGNAAHKFGVYLGFICSYALATTILFFILSKTRGTSIYITILITAGVVALGALLKRLLK
jgi:hypothetical protein